MVYKLRPLDLKLDFEDRDYELGDTINVKLELTTSGDVDVREGRVDLVCEERFLHSYVYTGPGQIQGMGMHGMPQVTHRMSRQQKERYVHSNVVFLNETRLGSGKRSTQSARLQIQTVPPRRLDEARGLQRNAQSSWTFKWTLVATIDVVRGRNPRAQRAVKITLPQAPVGAQVGAKPRLSTPKASTGPTKT